MIIWIKQRTANIGYSTHKVHFTWNILSNVKCSFLLWGRRVGPVRCRCHYCVVSNVVTSGHLHTATLYTAQHTVHSTLYVYCSLNTNAVCAIGKLLMTTFSTLRSYKSINTTFFRKDKGKRTKGYTWITNCTDIVQGVQRAVLIVVWLGFGLVQQQEIILFWPPQSSGDTSSALRSSSLGPRTPSTPPPWAFMRRHLARAFWNQTWNKYKIN